jgi:hypothetical protein
MGQSGAYITLFMTNIMLSLFSWCILSCMVPLPRAVRPPAIPFSVFLYWYGLMWVDE